MKQALIGLILSLLFASCTVAQALPTDVPASAPVDVLPATSPTSLPPTTTSVPQLDASSTPMFLDATSTPTFTPTPSATPLPTASQIPTTSTPDILGQPLSLDGYLQFFWDIETPVEDPSYYAIPVSEPRHDLYVAVPDNSLADWQTFPILSSQPDWPNEYTSWPRNAVSPDQTKLAFTLYKKNDANSYDVNINIADFTKGSLTQITEDVSAEIRNINWLPDNKTLIYSLKNAVNLADTDSGIEKTIVHTFPSNVHRLSVSPNGQLGAIILTTGELFFLDLNSGELRTVSVSPQLINPDNSIWSPDSTWFTTNIVGSTGLITLNAQTNDQLTLVESEFFSLPSWSPETPMLAFVKGTREVTNLYIWDPTSGEIRSVINPGLLNFPIWSPQGNYLAVASLKNEMVDLLSIDIETDEINTVTQLEDVKQFKILSWSPTEQWIVASIAQEDKSCLYIINRETGNAYCAVDSTGITNPFDVRWLPGKPHIP